jgi:sialidase-1
LEFEKVSIHFLFFISSVRNIPLRPRTTASPHNACLEEIMDRPMKESASWLLAFVTIASSFTAFCFAETKTVQPFVAYRADAELISRDGVVTSWGNLTRVHGEPRIWKIRTPQGVKEVVRFDGFSALWQDVRTWGTIEKPRTIIAFVRVHGEGVLCDGSTRSAADAIRVTAEEPTWQVLHFTREQGKLGGFIVGADVATANGLRCDVAEILVYDTALSEAEIAAETKRLREKWGTPEDLPEGEQLQPRPLFAGLTTQVLRRNGDDRVHTYRIPGLVTSKRGTLLAVFDLRHENNRDLPGNIDVGLTRSTDNGDTWSKTIRVLDYEGSGVGDPTILVDRETGRIFVAALWSKGNRAWNGSGPGLTPEETGQFVIAWSDDDGETWSKPTSITSQVKQPQWRLCFNGPGCGIQLLNGTLVMPAQYKDTQGVPHSCFIESRDHGTSWSISPPCDGRTSESQIAETNEGLLISMRDESRSGQRKWQRWDGKNWSPSWLALPDPVCQASLFRHPSGTLLFCNPANAQRRVGLTVRESTDEGRTWSEGRLIDTNVSMYSCMTLLRDGRMAVLYEGKHGLHFARFPLENANLAALPEGRFETTGKFGWWPARHAEKVAEAKENIDLVFLGDSITQGWEKAGAEVWKEKCVPLKAANYGFGGDSTQHVLWRLDHGEFHGLKPKVVVLHIGTNNARHGDFTSEQIAQGIGAVVEKIKELCPETKILLLAIFPRDAQATGEMRVKCEAVNALLPSLADNKQVHFLNINAHFLQSDGTLTREIAPDLLHLSSHGYRLWWEAMQSKLLALLQR